VFTGDMFILRRMRPLVMSGVFILVKFHTLVGEIKNPYLI